MMKIEPTKIIVTILSLAAFVTLILGIDKYFAKSDTVDIMMSDDQIFKQQTVLRDWEIEATYKKKDAPMSEVEKKVIEQERLRLEELEKERAEKVKRYNEKRK